MANAAFAMTTLAASIAICGSTSLLTIVPVAVTEATSLAPEKVMSTVSSDSKLVSPLTVTDTVAEVCPIAKVRTPATELKSSPSAVLEEEVA